MKVKDKLFVLMVMNFYSSYNLGDLGEIILEATSPYEELLCEIIGIDEDEYDQMINEALEISRQLHYGDMLKQLKNVGILKKD